MSSYTEDILISVSKHSKKKRLSKTIEYHVGSKESDEVITIPAGFEWDGASIPRFFGFVGRPRDNEVVMASLVHDYLYTYGKELGYTRKQSDRIFHEALIVAGMNKGRAWVYYSGVRVAGRSHRSYK